MWLLRTVQVAAIAVAAAVPLVPAAPAFGQIPCSYSLEIIESQACGGSATWGTGINQQGDVTGVYRVCDLGGDEAFLNVNGGSFQTLVRPPGTDEASAEDLNDAGQVAGRALVGPERAFVWQAGVWTFILPPPGGIHSGAYANSSAGVTGYRGSGDGFSNHAFFWSNGALTNIPPSYGTTSLGWDVNGLGQVVGEMKADADDSHGFLWSAGQLTDLGPYPGVTTANPKAISDEGIIVGWMWLVSPITGEIAGASFVWSSGDWEQIQALPGFIQTFARDVNNNGTVTGWCASTKDSAAVERAFVWHDGVIVNVNDLLPPSMASMIRIHRLNAINDAGQLTGIASTSPQGDLVAVVLTPVWPEPGDTNCDGFVDVNDLLSMIGSWGPCPPPEHCPADFNNDDFVDVNDLLILVENWG